RPKVFINTRFNIVLKGAVELTDKTGAPTRTNDWLSRRFDLFERICLPSLMAQTDTDFHWLVFFSDKTPEPFLTRIAGINQRFPQFIPCFLQDGEMQVRRYRAEVRKILTPEDTHIITARIDNDDAFHRTYVERLRAEFHGQEDAIINFLNGIQYDMDGGVVADLRKESNPFIARIEKVQVDKLKTVLDVMHHQAKDTGVLRDVDLPTPMWLQLIHSGNVLNSFASGRVRMSMDLEKEFGILGQAPINKTRSLQVAIAYRLFIGPMKFARGAAKRLVGR
ncbi:MAG TPA: glycosyltransferase, partial [Flavobacteriales bacterium]|nr:glycosyltransferase [Flavobacteriales bacterium]